MEKRAQVFVSSTYVDLVEERQAVTKILLEMDCFPAGMELFPAGDEDKWDLIKGVIDDSDYYVLILSGKYGSIDQHTDISYTEMEFDYAVEQKKPVLGFIRKDLTSLPVSASETNATRRKKLEAFHEKVKAKRNVKFFETKDELAAALATSLTPTIRKFPPVGWVRGDQAMTPETRTEIAELRAALAEASNKERTAEQPVFDDLADGEDTLPFNASVSYTDVADEDYTADGEWLVTWNDIFFDLGPLLIHETSQREIGIRLAKFLHASVVKQVKEHDDDDENPEVRSVWAYELKSASSLDDVLVQFLALRLIERGTQRRAISDTERYWKLTDKGEDRLMTMRAIRRGDKE